MADNEKKKKAQEKAKEYIDKNKIDLLLTDMLNTIVRDKPPK